MSPIPDSPTVIVDSESRIAELEARLQNAEAMLWRAVHLESVVRAALGGAPEFRNMLTGIQGHARLLLEEKPIGDPDRDSLLRISSASSRSIELLEDFRGMAVLPPEGPRTFDLPEQIAAADTMLRMILGEDVALDIDLLEPASVRMCPVAFRNMLVGLVIHALDRVSGAGMVHLSVERDRAVSDSGTVRRWAVLTLADTGEVPEAEALSRALDPLGHPLRSGRTLGIALSVAERAAAEAGGRLEVISTDVDSRVRVYLPLVESNGQAPDAGETAVDLADHILVVDDDDAVRDVAAKILRRMGYRITAAGSGEEALEVLIGMEQSPDLLLSDIVMPGMNGRELSERFRVLHPDKPVLFMSAYTEDEVILRGIRVAEVNFLSKPFTLEGLGKAVRQVLEKGRS